MKKLILVCLFAVAISINSFAQTAKTPAEHAASLKAALGLTDDQTMKVTTIYLTQDRRIDSLKQHDNGEVSAMLKKMMPILMSSNDRIMAILNPDQAAIFQKQVDAQKAMAKQIAGEGPPR